MCKQTLIIVNIVDSTVCRKGMLLFKMLTMFIVKVPANLYWF